MNESTNSSAGINVESAVQGIAAGSERELLPLDLAERVIVLKMRESGALRRHTFRRITRADVDAYYAATMVATQRTGQTTENEYDIGSAELKLYERAAVRVEGYKLEDGRDLMELHNWRERVPGGHRISAVDLLMKVSRSACPGEQLLNAEFDIVSLDAFWSEGDSGQMSWYRGLLHRFTPPTNAHWRKVNSFKTRSVAIGGSRGGQKTIYPKLDGLLSGIYDELIQEVAGYEFHGAALEDKGSIVKEMDPLHKIAAVSALFDKSEVDSQDEEAE